MPGGGEGSPDMRVIDPVSGNEHRFTAAEFFLCQAADGESTLSAIQDRYRERFADDIDSRQINAFYRRLRADGLLVRSEAARSVAPAESGTEAETEAGEDVPERARAQFQGERRASQRTLPRRIAGKNGDAATSDETADTTSDLAATPDAVAAEAEPAPRASKRVMPRRIVGKTNGEQPPAENLSINEPADDGAAPEVDAPAAEPVRRASQRTMPRRVVGRNGSDALEATPEADHPSAIARSDEAGLPSMDNPLASATSDITPASEPTPSEAPIDTAAVADTGLELPTSAPADAGTSSVSTENIVPAPEGAATETAPAFGRTGAEPQAPEANEAETARPRVTPDLTKRAAKPRPAAKAGPRPASAASLPRANIRVRPTTGDEARNASSVEITPPAMRSLPAPETDARRPGGASAAANFDANAFINETDDDDLFGGRDADAPGGRMARRRRPAAEAGGAAAAGVGALGGGGGFGGLGGGGLGGGGFGGGGFGGGMGGGGGFGGGGGRGEALMAALAARGRPGAGGAAATPAPPRDRVSLFNPMGLYWALNIVFWPMRYLHWLLWPLVAFTFFVMYQRWNDLGQDIFTTSWTWSTIALMLISFLIVNLVARTTQGVTIRAFGGQVRQFGLIVEFGFLPRFFIDRTDIPTMDRRGQLYCYAAPLVSRLWLWSGGMLIWASQHGAGNNLHDYALVISHAALIEFLCVAFPLLPSDGMNWLLTWFGDPALKKKAIISFKAWVTGQPRPFFIKPEEEPGLVLFAIGAILCSFLFVFGLLTYFGIMLGSSLGGTGAMIFLGLCLGCALWMYGVFANGGKNRGAMTLRDLGLGPQDDEAEDAAKANDPAKVKERVSIAAWGRVIWAFIIVFLIAVAFLPYDYEASGQFEILPNARNQANAQTDGEIEKILVREGDWVKPGELLGQLSSWDQEHEVAITKARLAEAKAKLTQLQDGAKSEQVAVAEKEVASQKATVAFTEAEMKRQQELEKTGTASPAAFERAKSKYDNDVAKLEVAVANLALVKSTATQAEIDARQADVDRLTAELAYNQNQLDRTQIRAPAEGRVITPNLHLLVGKWLRSGNPLLETENTKTVDAEIGVPESDIALVQPGDMVRIKAWGYSDREIPGKVVSIAPAADKRSYGMVVRAKATIPNEDGALRSQMTGYAKVEGDNMMVWQAFLRFIVRFFQVEVWSWIP